MLVIKLGVLVVLLNAALRVHCLCFCRTLITVTLLSFSVSLALKRALLPPPRATSVTTVTEANRQLKLSSSEEVVGLKKCVYGSASEASGGKNLHTSDLLFQQFVINRDKVTEDKGADHWKTT